VETCPILSSLGGDDFGPVNERRLYARGLLLDPRFQIWMHLLPQIASTEMQNLAAIKVTVQ
jgi:hypothetical protein